MPKKKTSYQCSACGYENPRWMGKCPECGAWNTMEEIMAVPEEAAPKAYKQRGGTGSSAKAGFVAIHLKNAMNVLGFRWKTNDKDKADFAFDFQGHYDITDIDEIPFEIYVVEGTAGS